MIDIFWILRSLKTSKIAFATGRFWVCLKPMDVLTKITGYWFIAGNRFRLGVQSQMELSGYAGLVTHVSCTTGTTGKGE